MNADKAVKVWAWRDAPEELRALSHHGGDEDWVALIPPACTEYYFGWMEDGTSFGCCDVQIVKRDDGSVVRIGAHA